VTGSGDGQANVWRHDACVPLQRNSSPISAVAAGVVQDSDVVAAASFDAWITIWRREGAAWEREAEESLDGSLVWSLGFHGSRCLLAAAMHNGSVSVWTRLAHGSWECSTTIEAHKMPVTCLGFGASRFATGSFDETVKLWKDDLCSAVCSAVTLKHDAVVYAVAVRDEALVASGGCKGVVAWEEHLTTSYQYERRAAYASEDIVVALCFSRVYLVSGSIDGTVRLWDPTLKVQARVYRAANRVTGLADTPDDDCLVVAATTEALTVPMPFSAFMARLEDELSGDTVPDDDNDVLVDLSSRVTSLFEAKILYSAIRRAVRNRELTPEEASPCVALALETAIKSCVVDDTHAKGIWAIIERAGADGLLKPDEVGGFKIKLGTAATLADPRFVQVTRTLKDLGKRIATVEDRVESVEDFTLHVNRKIDRLRSDVQEYLRRQAVVGTVSALVSIMSLGLAAPFVNAASDVFEATFGKLVDFCDETHVLTVFGDSRDLADSDKAIIATAIDDLPAIGTIVYEQAAAAWTTNHIKKIEDDLHSAPKPARARLAALLRLAMLPPKKPPSPAPPR